jgi:hypothetical protein
MTRLFKQLSNYSKGQTQEFVTQPENLDKLIQLSFLSHEIRERVTCSVCGIIHNDTKLSFDAKDKKGRFVEIKTSYYDERSTKKINGYGSFSDFTHKRHQNLIDNNYKILVSCFFRADLLYILEFDYVGKLAEHIEKNLNVVLPSGDVVNKYHRSIKFSYTHYKGSDIRKVYVRGNLDKYKQAFTKEFFSFMT